MKNILSSTLMKFSPKRMHMLCLFAIMCFSTKVFAQPANDNPCGAIPLTPAASCTYAFYTNVGATNTASVAAPPCAFYSTGTDVWFSVTVPAGGSFTVDGQVGTLTDSGFGIYTSSGGCAGAMTNVACDDDSSPNGLMSMINAAGLTPGTTVYIRVWGYGGSSGTFGICVTLPPPPPANDNPCSATPIPVNAAASCVYTNSTNVGATVSPGVPVPSCGSGPYGNVWFSCTVPASGNLSLATNAGGLTDASMAVYSGTCGALTQIACNDNGSTLMPGLVLSGLTPGSTVWISVWDNFNDQFGTFGICATDPPPPGPGDNCGQAIPFCTGTTYTFPNNTGLPSLGGGGPYGCLGSTPNPVWYFMQIANPGNIDITINQTSSTTGAGIDVDFVCWGPFASQAAACAGYGAGNIVDCSYSVAATEVVNIVGATTGQFYLLLMTNFSNQPGTITFTNTGGTGTTNCAILCNMTALTATPSACAPATNTYSVSGTITVTAPPSGAGAGVLTITSSCGGSTTINPPFGTSIPYTLSGLTPTGGPCNLTATFSADPTCTLTVPYTSPAPCSSCSITAGNTGPVCTGATFNLTSTSAGAGATYSWTGPSGFTSTAQNPTGVTAPAISGSYTYTVVATMGATTCTAATTVTVNPRPVITAPANVSVCAGAAIAATAFTSTPVGATYTWTNSNTAIGLGASGAGNVPGFTATNTTGAPISGTITVTPTLGPCPGTPVTYTITVNPQPTSTFTQSPNQCLSSNSFNFTNTGSSGAGYTYSWNFGGGGATPATSTTVSQTGVVYTTPGTYTVTHTITAPGGCTSSTTSTVTIFPQPVVVVNDPTICAGATATLTAGGASSYSWTTGATTNPITVTPASTTSYTVTGTDANGCTDTDVSTVTVTPLPVVTVNSPTICAGAAATLTAAGATTYLWSTGSSANPITPSPAGTTTYTVTGTTGACSNTAVATVTVNPLPTVVAETNVTVCAGATVAANTFASTPAGATFTWTNSNTAIGLAASGATSTPAFTATNATGGPITGTITITPTLAGCTGPTSTYTITVNPLPVVVVNSPTICPGGTASLTATGASTYTWSAGVTVTGVGTGTAAPAATTSYTVTGTSAAGCTSTAVATVTVAPALVITVNSPTICAGAAATLTAGGGTTYTWSAGATSTGVNTATASPATTTTYTVTGTTAGCSNTAVATVTVNPLPTVTAEANITVCAGATVAANTFASTPAGATFTWTNSNTAIGLAASGSTSTPAFTATNATASPITATITITPTLAGCVGPASTYTITVNPLPVTTVNSVTICPGGTATLTAGGASTYSWSAGVTVTGVNTATATPAATTSYTVTGTSSGCTSTAVATVTVSSSLLVTVNSPSICAGQVATLTAGGASTYTWSAGASSTGVNTASASPGATTSYTVTGTSAGCTATAVATVTVNAIPVTTVNSPTICAGATANLTAGGATSYTWSAGATSTGVNTATATPATTTTYTVTGTTAGCSSTAIATVTVNPLPVVTVNSPTICTGTTASLTASGATSYTWSAGATSTGVSTATAAPAATTSYTVTGTTAGCTGTAVATVTVTPLPTVTVNSPSICAGSVATLTASGATSYTWSAGASSTGVNTASASPSATTSYTVTGTSAGCTGTAVATVTVNAIPVTTVNSPTICAGATANLSAGGATTYTWSAGATSTGVNTATATPATTTTYTVTGTTAGCSSTALATVTVNPLPVVAVNSPTICAGQTATLTASGATTYTWSAGAVSTGVATANASPATTTSYTVTGTLAGCTATAVATVTVNPLPVTTVNSPTICAGATANLTAGGATSYTWSGGASSTGVNTATAVPGTTTSYTVTGTTSGCTSTAIATVTVNPLPVVTVNSPTICAGASATLTAAGAASYSWSTGASTNPISVSPATTTSYTVTGTTAGCTGSAVSTVTVNPLPVVSVTSATVCPGQTATMTASGATTYTWSAGATPSGPNTATAAPGGTTSYTVTGTTSGCTGTAVGTVTIGGSITVTVNSPTICPGGTATLTATGGTTYSWSTGATTNPINVSPASTTSYTVTGTMGGCTGSAVATVTVNAAIAVVVNSPTICNGQTASLTASGATTYSWSAGATSTGVSTADATPSATTSYTVTGTTSGCTGTAVSTVTVTPLPSVTVTSPTICVGTAATITASGATTYTWSAGATSTGVTTATASPATTTSYTVTGSASGCTNTAVSTVTVTPLPVVTVNSPTICAGLTATLTGAGATTYTWSAGATSTGVNTATASPATTTSYTVTGTATGCSNTAVATVTVTPLPVVTVNSPTICAGQTATLTASGATSYAWSPGASSTGVNTADATPSSTTTYTVTGTQSGCTNTAVATVTVTPLPTVTVSSPTICVGATATMTAGGATTYTWSAGATPSGATTATASPATTTTYTVTGTASGCTNTAVSTVTVTPLPVVTVNSPTICAGATATLTAGGATTYAWSAGATSTGVNTATATPAATTSYTVTGTASGCSNTAVATVTVTPLPVVTVNSPTICAGQTATLTASGATSYAWSPGASSTGVNTADATPSSTTTYTVTGTQSGCTNAAVATVTVTPLPTVTVSSPTICVGATATMTAGGATTYTWSAGATPSGATTATASPATTTTYTVTGTASGCTNTAVSTVTVNPLPIVTVNSASICPGSTATLTATGASTYTWSAGAVPTGVNTASATPATTTTYTVTGSVLGCTSTAVATVTINSALTVNAGADDTICFGQNTPLLVTPNGGGYTYSWSPAGGLSSTTIFNPTASPTTTTTYVVVVTDANGCTGNDNVTIYSDSQINPVVSGTNITCNSACNGSVTVAATGGSNSYTYSWTSGATTATSGSLCPGSYSVTVTDTWGCTATGSTSITQPTLVTASIPASTQVTCNGACNGTATAAGSGGTVGAGYTYSWNSVPVQTSITATALCAGSYTVTVSDANNCTATATVTITQPTVLTASITAQTNVNCFGAATGSVTVAGSGGTPTYQYSINAGATYQASGTFSSLTAGSYTILVRDGNGCTVAQNVTITQPTAVTSSTTATTNVSCFGGSNGSLTVAGAGGTPIYQYSLNGGALQASGTFASLTSGTYTVTTSDANGCTVTQTVTITQPTQVTVNATKVDATCGAANGSVNATGTGGTGAFTYSIGGPFQPSGSFTALAAATYTVTAMDANGCTGTTTITVLDLSGLTASITAQTNVSCFGGNNGSVTITASGSTGPYLYALGAGALGGSGTFTGLTQGSYVVTVQDGNGCTTTVPVNITQPTALSGSISSQTNITCNGLSNGQITVAGAGGTTTYTYSLDGGAFGASGSFTGLTVGTHTVTVQDALGCQVTVPLTITQPPALTVTTSVANATCTAANGSATATPAGGTPLYSYLWMPGGATTATDNANTAGNYTVTVTDANGCTSTAMATIGSNPGGTAVISSSTNVSCTGANDGSATVSMGAGSTPPYTYSWTPTSQTTVTATGLGPASYTVTVTDGNGCISTATTTITEPTILGQTFITTNVSCFGGSDGVITINATGGTPGYTYVWTPGSYTTPTVGGLTAGTYTVVFTDANGCQKTASVSITQPAGMNLSTTQVDATCNMSNGSATVTVTGGTGPYSYLWSDPAAQTTATATGLPSNTYVVTVTDANGCTMSAPVTINNLAGPVATLFSQINVSCFGQNDGAATVTISGGTIPFTFLWSNGQTLPTATNLVAGSYTLTATDASGCIASTSVTITQPLLLDLAMAITNPSCAGACDGQLISNTLGGTPPFTYLWNPGGVTTSFNTGLCAGTYTLQVTDANGCTAFKPATLTDPVAVTLNTTSSNVSCSGLCNGTATANPLSGTGPFTYQWSDISAQTTQTATGLCSGSYTVVMTDASGCTGTAIATITTPASMTAAITSQGNNTCFNDCDGYATAAVTGGTGPFAYFWMPGSTAGASVNNLCAATYTVTVTDANGCTASTSVNITQPVALNATITSTNVTCFNACDGTANAVYTGGTGPYTFQWTPGFQTTPAIAGICDGVHNLSVTDANGCTATASVVITQPTILAVTTTTSPSSCGNADGEACAAVTGGVPPFSYSWNDPSNQSTSCAFNVNAGNYIISITDGNGCSVTGVANVSDIAAPVVTIPVSANVTCAGASNGSAQANITGGVLPYNIAWAPGGMSTAFIGGLSGGVYSITVTDSIGCVGTASVTINEPGPLVSGILSSAPVSCFLSCDGTATVGAGGGTTPYTYLWNDAATQTTATATGLCAASYTVTITDANGCTSTSTSTITTPSQLVLTSVSQTNVSCNGGNNGAITMSASGGSPGYTYTWTPAVGSGPSVTNLFAGTYTVVVTDQNGCSANMSFTISEPAAITLATITNPSTCGNSNGSVSVSPSGGTPVFTYLWNDPSTQTTAIASGLPAGNYTVIVTDNNGCTASTIVTLNDVAGPTISGFTFTEPLCNGTPLGTATVLPAGGTPLYTYLWSGTGAQTTQTATALTAGVYTVTVTDNNGCSVTGSVNVTEPGPTQIIVSPTDTICVGENAIIYGAGYGGTPAYTYTWVPALFTGAGPHVVSPTVTTLYDVFLTDANGCVSPTLTITLFVNPPVSVTATDVSTCSGIPVTISAVAGGGNGGPYTYTWSNSVVGASQSVNPPIGLSPFDYIVAVDDGCSLLAYDTATVTVNPNPVGFMLANDTAGCEDFTVTFNGVSDIGTSYSWNFGDGSPTATGEPVTHTYPNSGNYNVTLTVTSALGCSSTIVNNSYITVFPAPTADFSYSPTQITQTAPLVEFTDLSTGVINSWLWNFNYPYPGATDTLQNPWYSYPDTGSYEVQLIVMNGYGCTDTAYQTLDVLPEYTFYAPNAFTPLNHDGINDTFMPQGVGIDPDNFEMTIWDRWGNMIYKTNDINKGWDGRANGGDKVAQIDVYVWKVDTKDYKGDERRYVGTVTIVK